MGKSRGAKGKSAFIRLEEDLGEDGFELSSLEENRSQAVVASHWWFARCCWGREAASFLSLKADEIPA